MARRRYGNGGAEPPNRCGRSNRFHCGLRGGPDGADRQCPDPVAERECTETCVEHHTTDEPVAELAAHPGQVPGIAGGDGTARLYREPKDALPGKFGDDPGFASPVSIAQVVQARPGGAYLGHAPELGRDERIDDAAEHLDNDNTARLLTAIRHASGKRP